MSKFWKNVCGGASLLPAVIAGTAKGLYNVTSGKGSFENGMNETGDKVFNAASEFGEKHGEKLTGAAITIGTAIVNREINNHQKRPPQA